MQDRNKNNNNKEEVLMQKHYKLSRSLIDAHLEGRTELEKRIILEQFLRVAQEMLDS